MDYKKLAYDLLSYCHMHCADCEYAGENEFECTIAKLSANAITDLTARAEAAENRAEKAEKEIERLKSIMRDEGILIIPSKYPGCKSEWNLPQR